MDHSIFLARVIGLCFVIFGILLFLRKSTFQSIVRDLFDHPALLFFGGSTNIIIGLLIIVSHNVWQADWRILITLIGWLLLIRGIVWCAFPKFLMAKAGKILSSSTPFYISAVISLILGIILCYFGFK